MAAKKPVNYVLEDGVPPEVAISLTWVDARGSTDIEFVPSQLQPCKTYLRHVVGWLLRLNDDEVVVAVEYDEARLMFTHAGNLSIPRDLVTQLELWRPGDEDD